MANNETTARSKFYPCRDTCKHIRHFKKDISLTGVRSVYFLKSEWENFQPENTVSIKYLFYRAIFMILVIFIFLFSLVCDRIRVYYVIYLTHWSLMTQVVYAVLFFLRVLIAWLKQQKRRTVVAQSSGRNVQDPEIQAQSQTSVQEDQEAQPVQVSEQKRFCGVSSKCSNIVTMWAEIKIWFLQSISIIMPIVVTLGFWVAVFKPEDYANTFWCVLPSTSMIHGANTVLALIDFMVIAVPVHVTHVFYVCAYGVGYLIFSAVYEIAGASYPRIKNPDTGIEEPGKFIYGFLNWKERAVWAGVASIVAIIVGVFLFTGAYLLYCLRLFIVSFFKPKVYEDHGFGVEEDNCSHCGNHHAQGGRRRRLTPHCSHCKSTKCGSQNGQIEPSGSPEENADAKPAPRLSADEQNPDVADTGSPKDKNQDSDPPRLMTP